LLGKLLLKKKRLKFDNIYILFLSIPLKSLWNCIGGNQKLNGFAVSHKRKRTSVENNEQSQNESQSTQTWREILGPAPPMGKTKV
jgi:hypothetical protein